MKKGALIVAVVTAAAYLNVPGGCVAGEQLGDAASVYAKPATAAPDQASGADQPQAPTSQSSAPKKTLRQKVRSLAAKILPGRLKRDLEFKEASAQFPDFCRHWAQNLRERERDNLSKLVFTLKDGSHTATYTGYGEVTTCEAHQSKDGFSIGRISYEEFIYYLVGPSPEEAVRGEKKTISNIHTTEIFRWENKKWFH